MENQRDANIYLAKLAEQAERFGEMFTTMKEVASQHNVEMNSDERNLFLVSYKNIIGAKRASWRILSSSHAELDKKLQTEASPAIQRKIMLVKNFKKKVEKEIMQSSGEVLNILDTHLLPFASTGEALVFFYKMKADCHRYLGEIGDEDDSSAHRRESAENSLIAYKTASDIAASELPPTHPLRLGLALNFSVFYFDILNSPDRACHLAKRAFDEAVSELELLTEDSYKDSVLLLQLLRDNLTLWTSDFQNNPQPTS